MKLAAGGAVVAVVQPQQQQRGNAFDDAQSASNVPRVLSTSLPPSVHAQHPPSMVWKR
jgi:hypothetical protein